MEKVARLLFVLLAANGKLAVLGAHFELIGRETRDRKRDAQGFRLPFQELDIVGRVAGLGFRRAVRAAGRGQADPETAVKERHARHASEALSTHAARRSDLPEALTAPLEREGPAPPRAPSLGISVLAYGERQRRFKRVRRQFTPSCCLLPLSAGLT